MAHLRTHQHADGRVAGEVVWNPMLPCQYVMLCHMLGRPIPPSRARQIYRGLQLQRRDDGGCNASCGCPAYLPSEGREIVLLPAHEGPQADEEHQRNHEWNEDRVEVRWTDRDLSEIESVEQQWVERAEQNGGCRCDEQDVVGQQQRFTREPVEAATCGHAGNSPCVER